MIRFSNKKHLELPYVSTWVVFVLFAALLLLKTMLFHIVTGNSLLISSILKAPYEFIMFWGGKMIPILLLSCIVFLTHRYIWTIILSFLVDIWCIAQLFYFKANALFMSVDVMFMADNMDGFWNSLLTYMGWDIYALPLSTIVFILILCVVIKKMPKSTQRYWKTWGTIFLIALSLIFVDNKCYAKYVDKWEVQNDVTERWKQELKAEDFSRYNWPFAQVYYYARIEKCLDYNVWARTYIKYNSIISFFPANIIYYYLAPPQGEIVPLNEIELNKVSQLIYNDNFNNLHPKSNLIYLLVESLESWPLDAVCGENYMPNCAKLQKREDVLCFKNLKSQTRHANSADGQMIGVTGLLPITDGATCRLYGRNKYPNYAHFFESSAIVNPAREIWQQSTVTKSYEFDTLIEPAKGIHWEDAELTDQMIDYIFTADTPFCVLGITVTSHCPFTHGAGKPNRENMPSLLSAYLNCLSYTDSCIGVLLDTIAKSSLASNTTIVITGDHTIFRDETGFADITRWTTTHDVDMRAGHTYTPLIIVSPLIAHSMYIEDECYQMDIYPTILSLLGFDEYMWRGVGENLMCDTCRNNRRLSEAEASFVSDKIIRSDYFRNYYYSECH